MHYRCILPLIHSVAISKYIKNLKECPGSQHEESFNVKNFIFLKRTMLFLLDKLEAEIRSKMICLGGGQWQCADCHLVTKSTNLFNHIEGKHVNSGGHNCQICGKFCRTKNGLIAHSHRAHSKSQNI